MSLREFVGLVPGGLDDQSRRNITLKVGSDRIVYEVVARTKNRHGILRRRHKIRRNEITDLEFLAILEISQSARHLLKNTLSQSAHRYD